jgi:Arc/MetJ-type ribon-helix-helix transcriptional regulator
MGARIKVVYHTQKVSRWHNDLKPRPNFLMDWHLAGTLVDRVALPPEVEILVQRQVESGKYGSIEEALLAGMQLLERQQQAAEADIYQGRLPQLQRAAQIGWEASQRGAVVDELGALNQLRSLSRLLSEARKFGGTAILGTQTEAQIDRNYGELDRRVILQGTCTKLILNCRDGKTAEVMADLIGKQARIDITKGKSRQGLAMSHSQNEQIREVHTVMPGELQSLPPLEGYLTISDGTPAARVKIEAQGYGKGVQRFVAIGKKAVPPIS